MSAVSSFLTAALLSTLAAWVGGQPEAFAKAYDNYTAAGKVEQFGINYPEMPNLPGNTLTPTSHHRFGNQTGIGSSTVQTESATAESMPQVQYRPTAVNPAEIAVPTTSPAIGRFHIFSQSMLQTPSLTQELPEIPSLRSLLHPGLQQAPGALPGFSLQSLSGSDDFSNLLPGQSRSSSAFGSPLLNPLDGF